MSSPRPELRLDWCSHQAARYAVEHWHYSRSLPPPPHNRIGVWENSKFIGCILFGRGASPQLLRPYGLKNTEGAELVRVALDAHLTPVSRIVSIAIKFLQLRSPGLRLLVSFADPDKGHQGSIYQAMNWTYLGLTSPSSTYRDKTGKVWHERMISRRGYNLVFGEIRPVLKPSECEKINLPGKHRYLMPLDPEMRAQIAPLSKPYPKRAGSIASDASATHAGEGGAIPTPALSA